MISHNPQMRIAVVEISLFYCFFLFATCKRGLQNLENIFTNKIYFFGSTTRNCGLQKLKTQQIIKFQNCIPAILQPAFADCENQKLKKFVKVNFHIWSFGIISQPLILSKSTMQIYFTIGLGFFQSFEFTNYSPL